MSVAWPWSRGTTNDELANWPASVRWTLEASPMRKGATTSACTAGVSSLPSRALARISLLEEHA